MYAADLRFPDTDRSMIQLIDESEKSETELSRRHPPAVNVLGRRSLLLLARNFRFATTPPRFTGYTDHYIYLHLLTMKLWIDAQLYPRKYYGAINILSVKDPRFCKKTVRVRG